MKYPKTWLDKSWAAHSKVHPKVIDQVLWRAAGDFLSRNSNTWLPIKIMYPTPESGWIPVSVWIAPKVVGVVADALLEAGR
jgi:hypothetical protein